MKQIIVLPMLFFCLNSFAQKIDTLLANDNESETSFNIDTVIEIFVVIIVVGMLFFLIDSIKNTKM